MLESALLAARALSLLKRKAHTGGGGGRATFLASQTIASVTLRLHFFAALLAALGLILKALTRIELLLSDSEGPVGLTVLLITINIQQVMLYQDKSGDCTCYDSIQGVGMVDMRDLRVPHDTWRKVTFITLHFRVFSVNSEATATSAIFNNLKLSNINKYR